MTRGKRKRNPGDIAPKRPTVELLEARTLLTLLTFAPPSGASDGSPIDQGYGDRVGDTANITVDYRSDGAAVRSWGSGFGDLQNVVYAGDQGDGILRILLTADSGQQVHLQNFDLAGYAGDYNINSVQVLDENARVVFSTANTLVSESGTHVSASEQLGFAPVSSRALEIRIDAANQGSFSDNIGIDNILFTQEAGGMAPVGFGGKPLYVIVHGADADGDHEPWMEDMADAIARRVSLDPQEARASRISYNTAQRKTRFQADPGSANFILFDWTELSGPLSPSTANTEPVAGRLAGLVADRLTAEFPTDIHFIGFSRGAYVVCDTIRRLADEGLNERIGFLQMTTLDPQNNIFDGRLESDPGDIVDWADNYYQIVNPGPDPDLSGEPITSALNFDLTEPLRAWPGRSGVSADHAEVHDWYHWTIATDDLPGLYGNVPAVNAAVRLGLYDPNQIDMNGIGHVDVDSDSDSDSDLRVDDLAGGANIGFHWSIGQALAKKPAAPSSGLDLVFVIDTTRSMEDDIDSVKASAATIVSQVFAHTADVRCGIVTYRDFDDLGGPTWTELPMTSDPNAVVSALNAISTAGGGDLQEAVYSGLMHALEMKDGLGGWRGGTIRKSVIWFGDAPPHDPEPQTGYTKHGVVARAFTVDPADLFSVTIGADEQAAQTFQSIAAGSRGNSFLASGATEVVDALLRAVEVAAPPAPQLPALTLEVSNGTSGYSSGSFTLSGGPPVQAVLLVRNEHPQLWLDIQVTHSAQTDGVVPDFERSNGLAGFGRLIAPLGQAAYQATFTAGGESALVSMRVETPDAIAANLAQILLARFGSDRATLGGVARFLTDLPGVTGAASKLAALPATDKARLKIIKSAAKEIRKVVSTKSQAQVVVVAFAELGITTTLKAVKKLLNGAQALDLMQSIGNATYYVQGAGPIETRFIAVTISG